MEEIKFRAKRIDNGKWVYGTPIFSVNDRCYMIHGATEDAVNTLNDLDFIYSEIQKETIGQFIGLHDKNGKEIYEGDILRSVVNPDIILYIEYDAKEGAYMAVQINKYTGTEFESRCHITEEWLANFPKEIIGNIYDDKDLIK